MIHPYAWNYQKNFIGADGKHYLLDGIIATKKGIDPEKIIEVWNRNYFGYQDRPYSLGESVDTREAEKIVDSNGRSLYNASQNHHMNQICAIVVKLTEIKEA